jgi:hypothetical protein
MERDAWEELLDALGRAGRDVPPATREAWYTRWAIHVDEAAAGRAIAELAANPSWQPSLETMIETYRELLLRDRAAEAELAKLQPPATPRRVTLADVVDNVIHGRSAPPGTMTVETFLVAITSATSPTTNAHRLAAAELAARGLDAAGDPIDLTTIDPTKEEPHGPETSPQRAERPEPDAHADRRPDAAPPERPAWRRTTPRGESR